MSWESFIYLECIHSFILLQYVRVMAPNAKCSEEGPFFPATPRYLVQNGMAISQDILKTPNWLMIFMLLISVFLVLVLMVIALVSPRLVLYFLPSVKDTGPRFKTRRVRYSFYRPSDWLPHYHHHKVESSLVCVEGWARNSRSGLTKDIKMGSCDVTVWRSTSMDSTTTGLPRVCILWRVWVSWPVSMEWYGIPVWQYISQSITLICWNLCVYVFLSKFLHNFQQTRMIS